MENNNEPLPKRQLTRREILEQLHDLKKRGVLITIFSQPKEVEGNRECSNIRNILSNKTEIIIFNDYTLQDIQAEINAVRLKLKQQEQLVEHRQQSPDLMEYLLYNLEGLDAL